MRRFLVLSLLLIFSGCKEDKRTPDTAEAVDASSPSQLVTKELIDDPENPDLYIARGKVYYDQGDYDLAIDDFNTAISLDSTKAEYYHLLADGYLDNNQSRDALAVMNKVVEKHPERIPSLLKLSEFQLILKQYDNSIRTINEIIRQDPQNAEAFFMLGMNFRELGKKEEAINAFQTSVEMDPEILDAWLLLGELHEESDSEKAITFYDNAASIAPDKAEPLHAKAFLYQNSNRIDQALEVYRDLNTKFPDYIPSYLNTGIIYMELDSLDKAIEQFNIIARRSPESPLGHYYLAQAHLLNGDLPNAKQSINNALNLDPDFIEGNELYKKIQELEVETVQ